MILWDLAKELQSYMFFQSLLAIQDLLQCPKKPT